MNFHGKAERLNDIDLPLVGHRIGVGEDEIHAIIDVECRGRGFDRQGLPAMLFEPHIFWRELDGRERYEAEMQGLARRQWKRDYPADSYPRLLRAMKINKVAALRSCSWGMGQIMGFNHSLAGFNSVEDMVEAFTRSELVQLNAMVTFIISAGLDDELRKGDWRGFARGYNGPAYATHNYHGRLKAAFTKWARIKDTPFKAEQFATLWRDRMAA